MSEMMKVRGLARHFHGGRRRKETINAVNAVDIDVDEGEIVGFLGPNGAGKTTTLRMLATLLPPTGGRATVAGHDLVDAPAAVRKRIGYVAQTGGTSPESTVIEEIHLQARLHGLNRTQARDRSGELMAQMDLTGLERRLTRTLSGGQRRRLDLAIGLVHTPPLMFLDEPTVGLDPQNRANLWQRIRTLRDDRGMTVFLTTHYLDEADTLADRILVIDRGQVIAEGTPDALKKRVSGDRVMVGMDNSAAAATAASLAERLSGVHCVSVTDCDVEFRAPRGDAALLGLLHALSSTGVLATSLRVDRPSLDDVFLDLTGRHLRDEEPAPEATTAEGTTDAD
jgi:ABC-2 type transport system ATP-binding protein